MIEAGGTTVGEPIATLAEEPVGGEVIGLRMGIVLNS